MEVGVGAGDLHRLVPDTSTACPSFGRQWNLTKVDFALVVDQPEGVDAEAFDHAQASAGWRGPTSPT